MKISKKLENAINQALKFIGEYESDTFSANGLNQEEKQLILAHLILNRIVNSSVDGIELSEVCRDIEETTDPHWI